MTGVTQSERPRRRPRRAGRRLALLLKIDETAYVVRPLNCDALAARRAYLLAPWHGLQPNEQGFVRLSIAKFSL